MWPHFPQINQKSTFPCHIHQVYAKQNLWPNAGGNNRRTRIHTFLPGLGGGEGWERLRIRTVCRHHNTSDGGEGGCSPVIFCCPTLLSEIEIIFRTRDLDLHSLSPWISKPLLLFSFHRLKSYSLLRESVLSGSHEPPWQRE